ncbi:Bifunctional apolipoprotein N-acyltransferase/polyprenol monophosphomannose synthase [Anaerolineae bacterium]|nr:Bifunctional apolipoprotein N-acyltransferase/polyprenol monophosphomannose synthase [Anaerolineae bacterium]
MYRDKRIALVIPARNEERLILPTLECVPALVDRIYVVDDASVDHTPDLVRERARVDTRISLIQHPENQGPGGAIISGYKQALADEYDVTVVIGGDNQMPLDQIADFLDPLINGAADYTKGNRFMYRRYAIANIPAVMPKTRLVGNAIISALTKIASGYYKIVDVVDGYTAINRDALETIDWDKAWRGYGYPMDFLIRLNAYGLRVKDIPRRAVYLPGERQSQIKGLRYAVRVSPMLLRGFFWRLWTKYILFDFHPLVFFYFIGITLLPLGIAIGCWLVYQKLIGVGVSVPRAVLDALLLIMGAQFLLFAMMFDMQESADLTARDRRASDRNAR